jgi:hypothetical protein
MIFATVILEVLLNWTRDELASTEIALFE